MGCQTVDKLGRSVPRHSSHEQTASGCYGSFPCQTRWACIFLDEQYRVRDEHGRANGHLGRDHANGLPHASELRNSRGRPLRVMSD